MRINQPTILDAPIFAPKKTARDVPTKIAIKADRDPTNLNFGLNKIRAPIIIAKT